MLIDTHAHLDHRQFSADLPEIIARARASGVTRMVTPATSLASCRALIALAQVLAEIHPALGIHPCNVDSVSGSDWIAELRELAQRPGIAAIGEIGLDYYHAPEPGFTIETWRAHQAAMLRLQLDLAVELKLNVILHTRESHDDLVQIMRDYTGRLRGVFHCFTGTPEQALELIGMGHLVSFTGIVTFKNSPIIQATAKALPSDAFMLETDSPYLAPIPHRGKRCEPSYVADTALFVAQLRGVSLEDLAAQTRATAEAFFAGLGR